MSVIPQQLVPNASQIGVESFSQIKPQRVVIKPNLDTTYRPNGVNRVVFKIPSFSNSFLDTSKSFLSFNVGYETSSSVTVTDQCRLNNGAPVFQRLTLKTSNGLVIDQISDYNVLSQLVSATKQDSVAVSAQEGRDFTSVFENGSMLPASCIAQNFSTTGIPIVHYINMGLLSKHTTKWLPLSLMSGGGFALELELLLSENVAVITQTGVVNSPVYRLTNVAYNLEIRTLDEALCKKFNEIACSGDEIRIGFKTMHTHSAILNSSKNIVKIHESATSLDRVWNVFQNTSGMNSLTKASAYDLIGAVGSTGNRVITRYNARIGSQWLYNDYISETTAADGNAVTISHVRNALDSQDKPLVMQFIDKVTHKPSARHYVQCLDFQYSGNSGFVNGISTSTPLEIYLELPAGYASNDIVCHSFAELSYDLVIKGGVVHYEEVRPGSNSVYS